MQEGSHRMSCYICGDKSSGVSKCSLRTAARRDIVYHELLPSGEPSEDALVPRIPYGSQEAIKARRAFKAELISCIPDHIPTTLRVFRRPKDTVSMTAQSTTATTSAPDLTLGPTRKLSRPLLLQMLAELEERPDPAPASAERDQAHTPKGTSPAPAMIDLTHPSDSSESFSSSSSIIELEPTVPIAAPRSSRLTILSSDSATLDRNISPEPSSSSPRVRSEIVVHRIAINNSRDPRAHKVSSLRFQQRQISVQVYSDQYDETTFDNAAATRDSGLGRGPKGDDAPTSDGETSKLAGTEDEEVLREIEELELEHVRMNSRLRRQRLITSAKAIREWQGDVGYEKDLERELQKKRKEQQAQNDEKKWELAKNSNKVSAGSKRKLGR